ncbi:MAG TPA: hypothetical protein VMB25_06940 [Bryobacteraceae bacterium]|nr:hypothetical protein [Bryobacteraceae bacterium]
MRILTLLAISLSSVSIASAQTVISAVTDAASYAPRVAPGSLASIFGSNLASGTAQATGFPLPSSLAGATVFVNSSKVPLLYASPTQINFQVPSSLGAGTANVYVTRGGGNSLPFTFAVTVSAPGIFQDTSNHAVAQNASAGYTLNSSSDPAATGSVVVVYMNGQGPVSNPVADGSPAPDSPLATATGAWAATLGGVAATVQFVGLTPGFTGLAQANIQIPSGLGTADYPLVISVGGYLSSSAMLSISGSATAPPTFLTSVGRLNFANDPTSYVQIYGNTTYVCGTNRIQVIDTSDVTNPLYVGEFGDTDLNGNGGKCTLNTSTSQPILVDIVGPASAQFFAVYTVANPTQPVKLVEQPTGNSPYDFLQELNFIGTTGFTTTSWYTFGANNAITSQQGDVLAWDFATLFPALVSAMSYNGTPASSNAYVRPNALPISTTNLLYAASTTGSGASTTGNAALDVINVSNIQSLQGVTRVSVANSTIFLGFGYDNTLLMLAGNTASFRNPGVPDFNITGNLTITTMDMINVDSPYEIKTIQTNVSTMGTYSVQPLGPGSDLFAIINNPPSTDVTGPGNLMIVDASIPTAPVLYPFQTQFGISGFAATASLQYLLVPDVNGLTIYQVSIPSS